MGAFLRLKHHHYLNHHPFSRADSVWVTTVVMRMIKEKCHVLDFPRLSCKYVYSACFIHELEKKKTKKASLAIKFALKKKKFCYPIL